MKKSILIIFLFFIYSCGYTSIYNNLEKQDLKIFIVEKKGDRVMNNLIQNEINLYSNKNSVEIFNITVDTKYEKIALTKDSTGAVTDYTISTNSRFLIKYNEKDFGKIF